MRSRSQSTRKCNGDGGGDGGDVGASDSGTRIPRGIYDAQEIVREAVEGVGVVGEEVEAGCQGELGGAVFGDCWG